MADTQGRRPFLYKYGLHEHVLFTENLTGEDVARVTECIAEHLGVKPHEVVFQADAQSFDLSVLKSFIGLVPGGHSFLVKPPGHGTHCNRNHDPCMRCQRLRTKCTQVMRQFDCIECLQDGVPCVADSKGRALLESKPAPLPATDYFAAPPHGIQPSFPTASGIPYITASTPQSIPNYQQFNLPHDDQHRVPTRTTGGVATMPGTNVLPPGSQYQLLNVQGHSALNGLPYPTSVTNYPPPWMSHAYGEGNAAESFPSLDTNPIAGPSRVALNSSEVSYHGNHAPNSQRGTYEQCNFGSNGLSSNPHSTGETQISPWNQDDTNHGVEANWESLRTAGRPLSANADYVEPWVESDAEHDTRRAWQWNA